MTTHRAPSAARSLDRARGAVSAIFVLNGAGIGLWAAHIPLIAARMRLDAATLGLVLLTLACGAMLAMPLAGAATARMGSKRATYVFALFFSGAMGVLMVMPTLPGLFVLAFLFGATNGALDVAMNANAAEVERARGRPTMSSFHGCFSLGGLAGAALGGLMIRFGLGEGNGAVIQASIAIIVIVLLEGRLLEHEPRTAGASGFVPPRGRAWHLGALALLCMVVEGALVDWSALLLSERTGVTASSAAIGYSAFSVTMAACRFAGDRMVARLGPVRVMVGGGIAIACGIALAVLTPSFLLGCAGFALVGLGAANVVPVIFSAAARIPGAAAETGLAAVATIGYTGFLLGPVLIGWIAARTHIAVGVGTLALAGVVIAANAAIARPAAQPRPGRDKEPPRERLEEVS